MVSATLNICGRLLIAVTLPLVVVSKCHELQSGDEITRSGQSVSGRSSLYRLKYITFKMDLQSSLKKKKSLFAKRHFLLFDLKDKS